MLTDALKTSLPHRPFAMLTVGWWGFTDKLVNWASTSVVWPCLVVHLWEAVPLYLLLKNDLFALENDEMFFLEHVWSSNPDYRGTSEETLAGVSNSTRKLRLSSRWFRCAWASELGLQNFPLLQNPAWQLSSIYDQLQLLLPMFWKSNSLAYV